ncbi:MAG: acetoacetate--CoA ligase, partial [Chloroflexota bacterium]|nr:acetoacetate--CoA ligase [Chloroflexota bacterium]
MTGQSISKIPLWIPSEERTRDANITRFLHKVNTRHQLHLSSYADLYRWSVDQIPDFWASVWDFAEIRASQEYEQVVDDLTAFPGAQWFPTARLNFAENLLRYRDDRLAFIFKGETQISKRMTYAELYVEVGRLAQSLREAGV